MSTGVDMLKIEPKKVQWLHYLVFLLVFLSVSGVLWVAVLVLQDSPLSSFVENGLQKQVEANLLESPDSGGAEATLLLLTQYVQVNAKSFDVMKVTISILALTLLLTLILLGAQMYMWTCDRKKLVRWKESGFLCENLKFLPGNRIKLNNIELELNKTQIENLKKLAAKRVEGKPLHSLDIGEHGVQAVKRLREELGARFLEKTLIKVRKREGYWLEINAEHIHDS